eukprot:2655015-Ditylum_brightwellii.AAC.1
MGPPQRSRARGTRGLGVRRPPGGGRGRRHGHRAYRAACRRLARGRPELCTGGRDCLHGVTVQPYWSTALGRSATVQGIGPR